MKVLVIESPGKVQKLKAILGEGWDIIPSIGHIRDLPEREIGVDAPQFRPSYVLSERGEGVIAKLRSRLQAGAEIYLATDPDREGESISWHIATALGVDLRTAKRVAFNQITSDAVSKAITSPRTVDGKLVAAQEARRVIDRLVGYLVSPELANRAGVKSAGRVQSVAVRLVVERERQIQSFKSTRHFGVSVSFANGDSQWTAVWQLKPGFVSDDDPYFLDRAFADRVANQRQFTVVSCDDVIQRRSPPAPFVTSTLQQFASVKLGLRPERTMEAAQALYEQGHISYHRTDNPNLAADAFGSLRQAATDMGLEAISGRRTFKAKEGAQAGHPAITPTHWDVVEAGTNDAERAVYKLIRHRAIASQLQNATYAARSVLLETAMPDGTSLRFEGKGRVLTNPGWMRLASTEIEGDEPDKDTDLENAVPLLVPGSIAIASGGSVTISDTRPPARFTAASLIGKLEAEGLGRPSTYAAIMRTVEERGYVKAGADGKLRPLEDGETLVDALSGRFAFMEVDFTRRAEEDFDRIANGKLRYVECVASFHASLSIELAAFAAAVPMRPSEAMLNAVKAKAKRAGAGIPAGAETSREICEAFLGPRGQSPQA
jgi:DNA topoisomerase-1